MSGKALAFIRIWPPSDVILTRTGMDDLNNVLVLTIFVGSVVAVIVGYLLAWRANRTAYRRAGSLMTAVVAGFAGLVGVWWAIGAVSPIPPPDGTSLWEVAVARSLFPFTVCMLGSCHKARASSTVSQFPSLMPNFFAPFTRRIPAAKSGLSNPVSAAS